MLMDLALYGFVAMLAIVGIYSVPALRPLRPRCVPAGHGPQHPVRHSCADPIRGGAWRGGSRRHAMDTETLLGSVALALLLASTLPTVVALGGLTSFELPGRFQVVSFHSRHAASANLYQLCWIVALVRGMFVT